MMRGRPVLGVISGFFFGVFAGISLFLWGVVDLHSVLLWILPLVGIVLGLVMAAWAPFGAATPPSTDVSSANSAAPATETATDSTPQGSSSDRQAGDDAGSGESDTSPG